MDKFKKYLGNYNLILLVSDSTNNPAFIQFKKLFDKKEFEKHGVKLKKYISDNFEIKVFAGNKNIFNSSKYIEPIELLEEIKPKLGDFNLSLYADYHPEKSKKGLGYKNKEKAIQTINLIKNNSTVYQKQVLTTMINRAKYHPNQTKEMEEAIEILEERLKKL
jgi:hypothetical protein